MKIIGIKEDLKLCSHIEEVFNKHIQSLLGTKVDFKYRNDIMRIIQILKK